MKPPSKLKDKPPGWPTVWLVGITALVLAVAAMSVAIVALIRSADHEPPTTPANNTNPAVSQPAEPDARLDPTTPLVSSDRPFTAASGRSPIPGPDEQITTPIAPNRLHADEPGPAPPPGAILSWEQAPTHMGHQVTVEGVIRDTHLLASGNICFLNFDQGSRESFYIALFREAFPPDEAPDRYFLGKKLRITGLVKTHRGRPQIEVRQLSQIEIVDP